MLVISCHADTCQRSHRCEIRGQQYFGYLDNFIGVHAVMQAYFSGALTADHLRIELTYGEETGYEGAVRVLDTLKTHDTVLVVDVTGTRTKKGFVVEKCRHPGLASFLQAAVGKARFDLYAGCPDPVADCDETDVYRTRLERVAFLGVPVSGGDYNREPVYCRRQSVKAVAEALGRITAAYPVFCQAERIPVH